MDGRPVVLISGGINFHFKSGQEFYCDAVEELQEWSIQGEQKNGNNDSWMSSLRHYTKIYTYQKSCCLNNLTMTSLPKHQLRHNYIL